MGDTAQAGVVILEETQSEQADRIAKFVQDRFKEYEKARKDKEDRWRRYYRMYRGKQWEALSIKPNKRKTRAVINYIFSSIETSVPLETDGKYRLMYQPREASSPIPTGDIRAIQEMGASDLELAKAMSMVADYHWRYLSMDAKLPIAARVAKIYGTAFFYTYWDASARKGVGDIMTRVCEPFHIYPDPLAKRVEDAAGFVYAYVVPLSEAKRLFPTKANLLKAADTIPPIFNMDQEYEASQAQMQSKGAVMILEYWLRDGATVTVEQEEQISDEKEGEAVKQVIEKLKYPNGRVITVAGDVLLEDKPNPYTVWPLDAVYDYDIGEFFGVGEIENLEQPQILYNKTFSQLYDNIRIMGNPNVVADKTSGVDWSNYLNSTGQVVLKEPGSEVRLQDPPQFSPALPEFLNMLRRDMDTISGIHDITQGRQPVGITAAQAIELLQQSAQTRIRLKIRNLLESIKGVGKKWFALVKQYYIEPRLLRVTGPEGEAGWLALQGTEFADADMDLIVETDSSFIVSKAGRFEQGLTLLKAQAISPVDLLKVTDWPGKEKIIAKHEQMEAMQMAQAAGQGAGMPSDNLQARINAMVKAGATDEEINQAVTQNVPAPSAEGSVAPSPMSGV